MSVVGPRPLTASDVARLGWLDRLYLRRQSLGLDLQLIALSLAVNVLGKRRVRRLIRAGTADGPGMFRS